MSVHFTRPCPVCGMFAGDLLAGLNFACFEDEVLPGHLPLVTCAACGHCFYDGDLSNQEVEEHYRRNQYYATSNTPGAGGESEAERGHQRGIIARLTPRLTRDDFNQPVYDVGCGRGGLLTALKEAGFAKAVGVELLPAATLAIQSRGLAALEGSALHLPEAAEPPGLLIYSHVFEHLLSPLEALAEARRKLAPGGLVYIEVPDAARYDSRDPWRALYQEHLNHFDMAALERLITNAGFEIAALEEGLFHLSESKSEGILWAVLRLKGSAAPRRRPKAQAAAALRQYLTECAAHPMMNTLRELARSRRPIQIWGLSQMTLLLLASSPLAQANLQGFIDSDPSKQSRRLLGKRVHSPLALKGASDDVLLAVPGRETEMIEVLRELRFQGNIFTLINLTIISDNAANPAPIKNGSL